MTAQSAFTDIQVLFDELLPKRSTTSYLQCVKIGYTLGDVILKSFSHLGKAEQRNLYQRLDEWLERRCVGVRWKNPHRTPRGDASVWLQSHFAVVLREALIEHGIMLDV